eukprot:gb/GFBE01045524.1/.p1 GENE.gb/GFBE01045524.1/~~gb/GFBE01045524.1/.p1  ORF type:complete len:116 (+),score=14.06 gb/GFBE01045524.1/:1-348(+)
MLGAEWAFGSPGPAADFEDSVGGLLMGTPKRFAGRRVSPGGLQAAEENEETAKEGQVSEEYSGGVATTTSPAPGEVLSAAVARQAAQQPLPTVPAFPESAHDAQSWRPSLRMPGE